MHFCLVYSQNILKTLEQLAETDTWPKESEHACDVTNSGESNLVSDHPETRQSLDINTHKEENSLDKFSGCLVQNSSAITYKNIGEESVKSESICLTSSDFAPDVRDLKADEKFPIPSKPVAFELETKAGHTTLFIHDAPSSPQKTPKEGDELLLQTQTESINETTASTNLRSSSFLCNVSPKECSSPQSLPSESSLNVTAKRVVDKKINAVNNTEFQMAIHSPRFCEHDSSDVSDTHHNDETAKDLIARYLPRKRSGPSVSKSYDQHFNSGPPKKLLPLRHSLDKMKPSLGVVDVEDKNTEQLRIYDHDLNSKSRAETSRFQSEEHIIKEKSEKIRSHEQAKDRKLHNNVNRVRRSRQPPYTDGQPYVPLFYSEIQHASTGQKKAKSEYDSSCSGVREHSKHLYQNLKMEKTLPCDDVDAQSAFMRSLNASASTPSATRPEEQIAALGSFKNYSSEDGKGEAAANASLSPVAPLIESENKLNQMMIPDQFHICDNQIYSDAEEHKNENGNQNDIVSKSFEALDRNENAKNFAFKRFSSNQVIKVNKANDLSRKLSDHNKEIRLDLHSSDMPSKGHNIDIALEPDDESFSVFSKSSSSLTPDGISLDSLSLSNDEDTVVDSLEFPDDSLSDATQELHKKEASKAIPPKQSQGIQTKLNKALKEPSQMDTRESFFLFDDSKSYKPFDIIKNIAVVGTNLTEADNNLATFKKLEQESENIQNEDLSQSFSRSSNARQRAREKKVSVRTMEADSGKISVNKTKHSKSISADHVKATKPKEKSMGHFLSPQVASPSVQPRLSLTGDVLTKGKQLLKPPVIRKEKSKSDKNKSELHNEQNLPRFSIDPSLLQAQKGQLKSVQTKEPPALKPVTHSLLPIYEDGLPSMANILKKVSFTCFDK